MKNYMKWLAVLLLCEMYSAAVVVAVIKVAGMYPLPLWLLLVAVAGAVPVVAITVIERRQRRAAVYATGFGRG